MKHTAAPIGGPLLTRPVRILLGVVAIAGVLLLWRFVVGLGPTTGMNDGYPWGLWIAFDVVVGTALATGGYALALLIYVLNRGKYHPLIRSALVTSALGYSLAGISVVIDLGRWWNVWRVPTYLWSWNVHSVLLEVAVCIMAYTVVLWLELSPAALEHWRRGANPTLRRISERTLPLLERAFPFLLALGVLLPTMHQSSLGSLMLLAGDKLHPLWQTKLLPLLFLLSCVGMGYAAVVAEDLITAKLLKRRPEQRLLAALARPIQWTLGAYVVIRVVDVVLRGRAGLMFQPDGYALLFWLELMLFAVPFVLLMPRAVYLKRVVLLRAALLIALAGGLYRFSTFLIAYNPGRGWSYFPAVPELLVTLGIIALEIVAYIAIIRTLPILAALPPEPAPERARLGVAAGGADPLHRTR